MWNCKVWHGEGGRNLLNLIVLQFSSTYFCLTVLLLVNICPLKCILRAHISIYFSFITYSLPLFPHTNYISTYIISQTFHYKSKLYFLLQLSLFIKIRFQFVSWRWRKDLEDPGVLNLWSMSLTGSPCLTN